jgi:SpoVK/Ycf46/Vps4 family AAA+-type ATPase
MFHKFRLEKRVMVPLPGIEAREKMIRQHLTERAAENLNYEDVIMS